MFRVGDLLWPKTYGEDKWNLLSYMYKSKYDLLLRLRDK